MVAKYRNITEPDVRGFQVRVVNDHKEYSRYFSHKSWGSKRRSLVAAKRWRDQMLTSFSSTPKQKLHKNVLANKKSTGVLGVSRSIRLDKRWGCKELVYHVYWKKDGKSCTKTFHVGRLKNNITADQEFHAFRTAVYFRHEYERWTIKGGVFDADKYKKWRNSRIYQQGSAFNFNS